MCRPSDVKSRIFPLKGGQNNHVGLSNLKFGRSKKSSMLVGSTLKNGREDRLSINVGLSNLKNGREDSIRASMLGLQFEGWQEQQIINVGLPPL